MVSANNFFIFHFYLTKIHKNALEVQMVEPKVIKAYLSLIREELNFNFIFMWYINYE